MPIVFAPKTRVYVDPIGEVALRSITLGVTEYFFELVAKPEITDKQFAQNVIFYLLVTPEISQEEFEKISDENLEKILWAFIETETDTFINYTDTSNLYADFRRAIIDQVEEEKKQFRETQKALIKDAEKRIASIIDSYGPHLSFGLQTVAKSISSDMTEALQSALATVAHVHFQPLRDLFLRENKKSIELFSSYWKSYFALNEKITMNLFSVLAAQNTFPQRDFTQEIQEASHLSKKNEEIFTERIREINRYPEEQKSKLYNKAGIKFFSVTDFEAILQKIKKTIEIHSQLMFWQARQQGKLAANLERIAQGHMMGLLYMGLPTKFVFYFQQLSSGSGTIDILLTFSNEYGELQKIILELKVFEDGHQLNDGIEQTAQYMENEETDDAYRVIFNATKGKLEIQERVAQNGKVVKDMVIHINLPNPSSLD